MRSRLVPTLESFALGDADAVDHLVLGEDGLASDFLLEEVSGPIHLLGDGASVDLDLHDVSFLLAAAEQLLLSVADEAHNAAVLLNLVQLLGDLLLAEVILPLLGGLGERLLLALGPARRGGREERRMSKTDPMLIVERNLESTVSSDPVRGASGDRENIRVEPTDGGAGLSTDSLHWRRTQRGSAEEEPNLRI